MDWRELIASVVDSLAWPVAIVVLVVVLREQMTRLLDGSLRRLKVGPVEAEWHEVAVEVATSTARAALPSAVGNDELDTALDNLERLARSSPGDAIQQTYSLVFQDLAQRMKARNVDPIVNDSREPNILIKSAYHGGVINKETGEALRGLLTLRQLSAHRGELETAERAVDYVVLARAVLYALSRG